MENSHLRDVDRSVFEKYEKQMPERFARRARHFYSEYARVKEGVEAWKSGDIEKFGQYIFESCESSIHNYECGSPELIAIYEIMKQTDGIYGGRFSGAGFKGACIALINPTKEELIRQTITEKYLQRFPMYKDSFGCFFCELSSGVDFL